jgi:hypothetical protein
LPTVVLDWRYHRYEIPGVLSTPGWRAVYNDRMAMVLIEEDLAERLGLPSVVPAVELPDTETSPDH